MKELFPMRIYLRDLVVPEKQVLLVFWLKHLIVNRDQLHTLVINVRIAGRLHRAHLWMLLK